MLQQLENDPVTTERLARIEANICGFLSNRVRDFRLLLCDEGLILTGWAKTYYAKQLAQHAVMEAVDLPICANEIKVV